jgi:hypothetical protein
MAADGDGASSFFSETVGVSLAEAIWRYGGLSRPNGFRAAIAIMQMSRAVDSPGADRRGADRAIEAYVNGLLTGGPIVVNKLRAGQLGSTGLVRGASPGEGAVVIHPDQWRVLVPDYESSSAASTDLALVGVLVFPAVQAVISSEQLPTTSAGSWETAERILDGPAPPPRGRGRLTALARAVNAEHKKNGYVLQDDSVRRQLQRSFQEWQKKNTDR